LARPPGDKYIVATEATFAALAAVCDGPTAAGRDLLRQLAFAYLTGNGDAHAKNFSVLRSADDEWRVSPTSKAGIPARRHKAATLTTI
jgi:serine/threonine-protein kinase HipA